MTGVRIYHNPSCSKSRGALAILREQGVEPEVIEYLREPPGKADLERLLELIDAEPEELVRRDQRFRELGLDAGATGSAGAVVSLLLEHPELMQRPVVVRGERAVIARPSEKVLELLGGGP